MKITKIQTWLVRPRWAFIEISTDAGISGWGEPVLEGRAATVCECIHEMEPYLIGADPKIGRASCRERVSSPV